MGPRKTVRKADGRDLTDELTRRRYVCARCWTTWTEPGGSVVVNEKGGGKGLPPRVDVESEICQVCQLTTRDCQMCWLQARVCQKCGSKDVYEVGSAEGVAQAICRSSPEEV